MLALLRSEQTGEAGVQVGCLSSLSSVAPGWQLLPEITKGTCTNLRPEQHCIGDVQVGCLGGLSYVVPGQQQQQQHKDTRNKAQN